jgi:hydroxyethylthiazole kinase-like uncharacterized protein yjeF
MAEEFNPIELKKLYRPEKEAVEHLGQITIIGGSRLFHGAPILSLKVASRIVGMVFFTSPEASVGKVAEEAKSKLSSFIWVPLEEIEEYLTKSDAILIGPGFMRFRSEKVPHGERHHVCDEACQKTKEITQGLLTKFPEKRWVIDAGSLQVLETSWIPPGAILTPNKEEYELLFGEEKPEKAAKKYKCHLIVKGPVDIVCSPKRSVEIKGGNIGMAKGGTGDVLAGLAVSFLVKNEPFLAACAASYITKASGDELYRKVGVNFNADDLAETVPQVAKNLLG